MITQRRRLFQAVISEDSQWRQKPLTNRFVLRFCPVGRIAAILTAALLFLGPGCASLTPNRINAIAAIAGAAVQIGAAVWLDQHPEDKPLFNAVILTLSAIAMAGQPVSQDQETFVKVLATLPTPVLKCGNGALCIVADHQLVVVEDIPKRATLIVGALEAPVRRATLSGLKAAMAPKPPVLPSAKTRRGAAVEPKPLSDAELDAQFESLRKQAPK